MIMFGDTGLHGQVVLYVREIMPPYEALLQPFLCYPPWPEELENISGSHSCEPSRSQPWPPVFRMDAHIGTHGFSEISVAMCIDLDLVGRSRSALRRAVLAVPKPFRPFNFYARHAANDILIKTKRV